VPDARADVDGVLTPLAGTGDRELGGREHGADPVGEGRVVDGCITCPWHGYQYLAESGQSPPPFTERIPTYELRIEGRTIFVSPKPNAPGTPVPPCAAGEGGAA
jgi:hypothetical protein